MKRNIFTQAIFRLACTLILFIMVSPGQFAQIVPNVQSSVKKKVAIYMTGAEANDTYKKVIGAKLVTAITESGDYAPVERTADFLDALSAEQNYQTSGDVRNDQIAKIGQRFGVKYVVVADVSEIFDEIFIAARIINVENGLVERACDVNGPAENMSQLIALSKQIALGLMKGVSQSTVSANSIPINFSLCVTDSNGKIKYFSAEAWNKFSEGEKLGFKKKGIAIFENGEGFLLDLREPAGGKSQNWNIATSLADLPQKWQLKLIYKNLNQLNEVLEVFGGELLKKDRYWSIESPKPGYAWFYNLYSNYEDYSSKVDTSYYVRGVSQLPTNANDK